MTARPASFDALLVRYLPGLKLAAARMTRPDTLYREDLLNDTVARCLVNWQKYRTDAGFYGWAIFIMRECARERRVRAARHAKASASLDTVHEWQVAVPATQEYAVDLAKVMAHVDTMPPRRAMAIRMRAAGFTEADIAPLLGITRAAVGESCRRSQRELAERFGDGDRVAAA